MPKINLILVGNPGSGKTSMVNNYVYTDYAKGPDKMFSHKYNPTIGINLERKLINLQGQDGQQHEVSLYIWDTAGQDKFFSLTKNYFRQADGVIVVFDVTDKSSFFKIEDFWMKQIEENCKDGTEVILVGNKVDLILERAVDKVSGEEMAKKFKMPYVEVSAKYGDGIDEAMNKIATKCLNGLLNKKTGAKKIERLELDQPGPVDNSDCFAKFRGFLGDLKKKISF
mmetsp:Transcript_41410/g.48072  ORF Transcript_41410/g.48072 Transcript_41410/m.48072 type:complete len:226 (+) Transcript_41410:58-735(+)